MTTRGTLLSGIFIPRIYALNLHPNDKLDV
jgi:hypothetical protein